MTAPPAPLDRAVEKARKAMAFHARTGCCRCDACAAITALLAALDADKRRACRRCGALATDAHFDDGVCMAEWVSNGCDYADALRRLEEAETALREIADGDCETVQYALREGSTDERTCAEKAPAMPDIWCGFCIARRYFARREGEKGVPE